jgi:hypothetical protein
LSLLTDHQHYEELCALVASGQASEVDLLEWQEHAQGCADCRALRGDYAQTARTILVSEYKHAPRYDMPAGMTERFIAHARSAGLPLSGNKVERRPSVPSFRRIPYTVAAAALIALIGLALLFFLWMNEAKRRVADPSNPVIVFGSPVRSSPTPDAAADSTLLQENLRLTSQLREAQSHADVLVAQLKAGREALESADRKRLEITERLGELQNTAADLQGRDQERDGEIAQLREQLKNLNSERDAYRAASFVQESELNTLHTSVQALTVRLDEAQHLNAAANQAKDLIVARNLHIVDVNDADENGNRQRAFGRIFYTEGKSLVFYAYDLADSRTLDAKLSFYVWGERLGNAQTIKSLGIFRSDNKIDSRWVLVFDDPKVLAQIDSVFVTVESGKHALTEPRGKKVLYAYVGNKPNHP